MQVAVEMVVGMMCKCALKPRARVVCASDIQPQIEGGSKDDAKGESIWDVFAEHSGKVTDNADGMQELLYRGVGI